MADDRKQAHGQDRQRVNVNEDYELHDWARRFDVSPEQLREAVAAVGDRAADVELHLKGTRASSNAATERQAAGR